MSVKCLNRAKLALGETFLPFKTSMAVGPILALSTALVQL